jgi:glycosyltransferase involved in cell wall biosynthesis
MKISYAIPVCTEHVELKELLTFLTLHIEEEDEIVVQCDQGNTTHEVHRVLGDFPTVKIIEFPLKGNFASFKNNLKEHCTGEWIFQIDADELPTYFLIKNLKELLKLNPTTELFLVPRVNTVKGLTQEHINKWRWNINESGWVNWPDYQTRIIQNHPKIAWASKVHEVITGFSTQGALPMEEEWSLYHHKHIDKQEHQNKFYDTL